MLLFRSEEHVERWCRLRGLQRGGAMTPQQCWEMARAWYGEKLSPDWRRATPDEAQAMLTRIGLTDPFWRLRP